MGSKRDFPPPPPPPPIRLVCSVALGTDIYPSPPPSEKFLVRDTEPWTNGPMETESCTKVKCNTLLSCYELSSSLQYMAIKFIACTSNFASFLSPTDFGESDCSLYFSSFSSPALEEYMASCREINRIEQESGKGGGLNEFRGGLRNEWDFSSTVASTPTV